MAKNILVVDDHPLFRKALVGLAEECNRGRVTGVASAEDGLQKAMAADFDLILLDLGLPGAAGADAISQFRNACDAKIVVVSASEHRQEIIAAMRAGAYTVVSKAVSMEVLREVIDQALSDTLPEKKWIRPIGTLVLDDETGQTLTARQQEIATLLTNGHSNKEIGMRLGLAEITVKTHLTAIFRLLGVVNRTQAVVAIRRWGVTGKTGPEPLEPK